MFYALTYALAIPSPIIVIINAEAWAVFIGLLGTRPWPLVALAIALGQCTTFSLLFFSGKAVLERLPRLKRQVERIDLARFTTARWVWLVAAAVFAIPPMNALSILAPMAGVRYPGFLAVAFAGRLLRFAILAGVPGTFQGVFDPNVLPTALRALV